MHAIVRTALLAAAAGATLVGADGAREAITAAGIRSHLLFLSHDLLEGRAPGTRGGEVAAEYIAARMMEAGLEPVEGSYFQPVPLVGVTVEPETVRLEFSADGRGGPTGRAGSGGGAAADGGDPISAGYPSEAVVWPGAARTDVEVAGEVVFVGYGIQAPDWDWNDYANQDMAGKVALILVGDPPASPDEPGLFEGRALTYYGRWSYKLEEARRHGAAGALLVHRTDAAGYGWEVVMSSWTGEQFMLPEGRSGPPVLLNGWLSAGLARRVLARAGHDLDELYVRAARRDFRPLRTGLTVRSSITSGSRRVQTRNVVGVLPGSDPDRAAELVVLTSHYDHLGVGVSDSTGDSIYNGAYDNAGGVGILLEVAEAFGRLEPAPDRSLLFIATAAEEAGMLGSRHYVTQPLYPLDATVAALNVDGANLWGETDDVIGLGTEQSTLGEVLRRNAGELGLEVRPDPAPQTGSFFRSDHFPFAQAGVPVLSIEHGLRFRGRPDGWGEEVMDAYIRGQYHQPGDEYRADFDLSGAVQQALILFDVGLDIATTDSLPRWHETAPFRATRQRSPPAPRRRARR